MYQRRLIGVVAILCLTACRAAVSATEVISVGDVARTRLVTQAFISPDGQEIAYVLGVPRDPFAEEFEDGGGYTELHVVNVANGRDRGFITGKVNVSAVAWRPDGKAISFLSKRGSEKNECVYEIAVDGGEARKVVSHETDITAYSWSPDGKQIAFLATKKKPEAKEKLHKRGFKAEVYEEEFENDLVWIAGVDEGSAKAKSLELKESASVVHWSPVGDRLLVALAPTPLIDDEMMARKLCVVDAKNGKIISQVKHEGKIGPVTWSPDGKHLAALLAADINDNDEGTLMVCDAADGSAKVLLPKYEGRVSSAGWQDSQTIMFVGDEWEETVFAKIKIDGSGRKVIVPKGGPVMSEVSLSKDGQSAAFVGSTPECPPEVFFMRHGDASPRRMTHCNPWLESRRLAKQEAVSYKARDGQVISGVLIHPLDEKKGTRYPLILCVHGGPEAHERNAWLTNYSRPGQLAAARGFAVFYPNYRGSTGRGVAYSKLSRGDEAGKEFDDLVDAVEHFVKTGLADTTKVGVTGGSYGGYASAWCATALSDHFAASVMFVGISDAIGKKGTTDIPSEDYLVHTGYHTWENKWQFCLERSPIYHVKEAHTPILILGGKDDTRVHPSQSLELYRFLKTLGKVPVRLVRYPGEQHGNRKAAARLDYNLRMMQWMEHYLKGPGGKPPAAEIEYGLPKGKKHGAAHGDD